MLRCGTVLLGLFSIALFAEINPWKDSDLIEPAELAARLAAGGSKMEILYVGFPILYHGAHITGAELAGPASKSDGLEVLKRMAAKIPRDRELVIYCGCCPWNHCPNVRPAFRVLREMGFTHLKLVSIPTNLSTDWIEKGFPAERAAKSE
jgi:thiosulfate/3-mercaptopyruvate sulfurtransferase